ncbi:MAG: hypothetical protein QOG42_3 [Solirubrobacteraceae bacterium]|nr:hypothetical protein [Solirubrobacteraceae bacterium]
MNVEVALLSERREDAYARFVAARPDALISYTLGYRDLLLELLGCQARYGVALRDDAIVGVMPLMSVTGEPGTVLNSLPYFGSNGGPLASDREACDGLCAWYAAEAAADGVVAATVIANPLAEHEAAIDHDLVDLRISHVTGLAGDGEPEARIWAAIDSSARRNVKKAQRAGTTVAVENESFGELEALHRRSMEAIGAQVKAPAFFDAVQRNLRAAVDFDLYVARIGGAAVAALLVFYCAAAVDYYVPAVDPEHRGEQPMAAILIRAMSDAAQHGREHWNWGGSWPSHESLQRFKAKWGGVRHEYLYETKVNDRGLLSLRPEDLLAAYPGFFVVPFSCLDGG